MKIKTITCHNVYNFGASLQAYALMKYLETLGHDVEIIDYRPDYLSQRYNLWGISSKWGNRGFLFKLLYYGYKVPERLLTRKGKYNFDSFSRKYLRVSDRTYRSYSELENYPPEADVYIAGSDQIWNTHSRNGRDPAFFLDFVPPGKRKVSYAASFATLEVLPEYRSFVQSRVETFDYVSVREREGLDILERLGVEHGKHVLDPVFLIGRDEWERLANDQNDSRYLLVYDFDNNPAIKKFVQHIAREEGLQIVAVNNYTKTPYADHDYFHAGPETFISLIKNAEYIITNSFHATVFSLIFEKEFFVYDRMDDNANSRMTGLLELCGLEKRLIHSQNEIKSEQSRIDYDQVRLKLDSHLRSSKKFLDQSLNRFKDSSNTEKRITQTFDRSII
ncbi:polysaccharide pyruvyl transferase family protein [Sunxiuqinia sp. sy24]|uniref:polysaccharide pyruvyl transferase family protein n=1 Tax=Sunxiuqinia sp. sy24 TaxID=3461495 RepID=UPI004045D90C